MAKSKEQLSEEAKERRLTYNKLSPAKKLELIHSRRGKSKKEESKILKIIKEKNNSEKTN
jgi:hypothetical protein